MLRNGKWIANWQPAQAKDEKGGFARQTFSGRLVEICGWFCFAR